MSRVPDPPAGFNPTGWPYDTDFWGPGGIDMRRFGPECARGIRYKETGAPVDAGTPGQVRKISSGRKTRGLSSDDYKGAE